MYFVDIADLFLQKMPLTILETRCELSQQATSPNQTEVLAPLAEVPLSSSQNPCLSTYSRRKFRSADAEPRWTLSISLHKSPSTKIRELVQLCLLSRELYSYSSNHNLRPPFPILAWRIIHIFITLLTDIPTSPGWDVCPTSTQGSMIYRHTIGHRHESRQREYLFLLVTLLENLWPYPPNFGVLSILLPA